MGHSSDIDALPMGTLWMLNLDSTPMHNVVPRVPTTFQCLKPEEALSLAQAMELDDPDAVQQRLATGRRCYIALVEGRYASYAWVTFDREEIGELGLHIRLAPGEAYIWNCLTLPAYRGLRLYPAMLTHIVSELRAEGLSRIWIGADVDNAASQTGMSLAGFVPVADIVIDCVLTLRRPWLRGQPGVPEELVMDARYALFGHAARAWLAVLTREN